MNFVVVSSVSIKRVDCIYKTKIKQISSQYSPWSFSRIVALPSKLWNEMLSRIFRNKQTNKQKQKKKKKKNTHTSFPCPICATVTYLNRYVITTKTLMVIVYIDTNSFGVHIACSLLSDVFTCGQKTTWLTPSGTQR